MDDFGWWAAKWWVAALFGGILALWRWLIARQKKQRKEAKVQKDALVAIMYDRLTQAYNYYSHLGFCTMQDRHNFTKLFKAYQASGGNDNMEDIMQRLYDLPTEKPDEKKED